ncbi:Uncharacterized protein PBTT_05907 [Plasmodiophora brassicae]
MPNAVAQVGVWLLLVAATTATTTGDNDGVVSRQSSPQVAPGRTAERFLKSAGSQIVGAVIAGAERIGGKVTRAAYATAQEHVKPDTVAKAALASAVPVVGPAAAAGVVVSDISGRPLSDMIPSMDTIGDFSNDKIGTTVKIVTPVASAVYGTAKKVVPTFTKEVLKDTDALDKVALASGAVIATTAASFIPLAGCLVPGLLVLNPVCAAGAAGIIAYNGITKNRKRAVHYAAVCHNVIDGPADDSCASVAEPVGITVSPVEHIVDNDAGKGEDTDADVNSNPQVPVPVVEESCSNSEDTTVEATKRYRARRNLSVAGTVLATAGLSSIHWFRAGGRRTIEGPVPATLAAPVLKLSAATVSAAAVVTACYMRLHRSRRHRSPSHHQSNAAESSFSGALITIAIIAFANAY